MEKRWINRSKLSDYIELLLIRHETISILLGMLFSFALLEVVLLKTYPLHTTTDELGAIVGAATLAGYDWSGVIDRSGYYGFGYYSLFAPLFMMKLSPIVIYRVIAGITSFIRGCSIFGITYYIGKKYIKFESRLVLFILSILCTIPICTLNWASLINDLVLDVCFWFIILSICKMIEHADTFGRFLKWMLFYAIAMSWMLLLHTRALVVLGVSLLTLIIVGILKKKKLFFLVIIMIPMTFLAEVGIHIYQNTIWKAGEELANTSVRVETGFSLFDWKTWEIWLDMVIGNISVLTLLTGGLFWAAIIVAIKYFLNIILKKDKYCGNIYINVILIISGVCMAATFGAFMLSGWFVDMYHTWDTAEMGKVYSYKALCYVRYWGIYAAPFLFTGIYLLGKKQLFSFNETVLSGVLLLGLFVECVIPIIQNNSDAGYFLCAYLTEKNESVTAQFYYKSILICIIFIVISVAIYYGKKDKRWVILPTLVLMAGGYYQANINYSDFIKDKASSMVLASYEQKVRMEQSGMELGQIYAYDDRKVDRNWYIFSILQFYFYDHRIEDEYPERMEKNDIIVTYNRIPQIEADFPELKCYRLDDNEVWYTSMDLKKYGLQEEESFLIFD